MMFTLKAQLFGHFYTVDSETESEILSLAVAAFDNNAQLCEIREDDVVKYVSCEIYTLIHRACY